MTEDDLPALAGRARLAIEGSLGEGAAQAVFDYLDAVLKVHGDGMHSSGSAGSGLAFFLAHIRQAADPAGDSIFRLQVVRRNPNSKRTPAEIRAWESRNVNAALLVESLVADTGLKKESAIAEAMGAFKVRRADIFRAEKTLTFRRMVAARRSKRASTRT